MQGKFHEAFQPVLSGPPHGTHSGEFLHLVSLLDHSGVWASVLGTRRLYLDKVAGKYYFTSHRLSKAEQRFQAQLVTLDSCNLTLQAPTERARSQTLLPILCSWEVAEVIATSETLKTQVIVSTKKCTSHKTQIPSTQCPPSPSCPELSHWPHDWKNALRGVKNPEAPIPWRFHSVLQWAPFIL